MPAAGGGAYFSPEGAPVCCADFPGCHSFDSPLTSSAAAAAVSASASLSLSLFEGAGDAALFERRRRLESGRQQQHSKRQLDEVSHSDSSDHSSYRGSHRSGNHSKHEKRSRSSRSRGSSNFAIDFQRAQALFRAATIAKGSSGDAGLGQTEFTHLAKQLLSEQQTKASAVPDPSALAESAAPMPQPPRFSDAELQMAFFMADTNGNGLVDENELNELLRSLSGPNKDTSSGSSSSNSGTRNPDGLDMNSLGGLRKGRTKRRDHLHVDDPSSRQVTEYRRLSNHTHQRSNQDLLEKHEKTSKEADEGHDKGRQLRLADVAKRCHWAAWKNALVCDGNGAPTGLASPSTSGGIQRRSGSKHNNIVNNNNLFSSEALFAETKVDNGFAPPPAFASSVNNNIDANTAAVMAAAAELVPNALSDTLTTEAHQAQPVVPPHKQGTNGAAGGAPHPLKKAGGLGGKHNANSGIGGFKGGGNGGSSSSSGSGGGRAWSLDAFKDSGSSGRDGSSAGSMPRLPDHLLVANHTSPVWSRYGCILTRAYLHVFAVKKMKKREIEYIKKNIPLRFEVYLEECELHPVSLSIPSPYFPPTFRFTTMCLPSKCLFR